MRRKWAAGILILFLTAGAAQADAEISVQARAAILIDRASGRVLYEKNADVRYPVASTTKIMTALIAVEHCGMDEIVTAGPNASGVPGTSIYLSEGERLTMHQMLQGLMLRSGNDAAVAIAEHIAGNTEMFASLMNARAEMLGADTHFVTPNGLDEGGHGASARAMALIAREAMGHVLFRELAAAQEAVIPWVDNEYSRVLRNKNRLLSEYEGATGVKTGFTSAAGRCLVFSAERDGMELIGVVLNCPDWFEEAKRLLDWGFANFSMETAAQAGEKVTEANILNGEEQAIPLYARETVAYPVGAADEWRVEMDAPGALNAPVSAGETVGYVSLIVNGGEAARCDLITGQEVRKIGWFARLRRWFSERFFFRKN